MGRKATSRVPDWARGDKEKGEGRQGEGRMRHPQAL